MLDEKLIPILRKYSNVACPRRPFDNKFTEEYNRILLQIVREENQLIELPIITEMDFGHTSPTFTIPFGLVAEINCEKRIFSILDNGVTE